MKFEKLPKHLQEVLNKKKEKKTGKKGDEETVKVVAKVDSQAAKAEDGEKLTVLNLKDDFLIDYTKIENVQQKLKSIKEEQLRGKKHATHHVKLLTFMIEKATDARQKVEILLNLLNAIFSSAKTATPLGFLTRDGWMEALKYVKDLISILNDPLSKASLAKVPSGEDYTD